jgi:hypothetical protein
MTFASVWALIGDYTIAAALGAVVSSGEIVARYRDEPWDTLRSLPSIFYMLVNALASMGALTIVRTFGINFGGNETNTPLIQVLVAGLGAMMIFRSAFFTMRVNDQDVAVGAASFLQVMLDAVDREVDRRRAILRADRVRRIMDGVAFDKALTALPTYSIALMQNMEDDDQRRLLDDLNKLSAFADFDDAVKTQILGLAVMNYLGEDVLQASVDALRARINLPGGARQPPAETPSTSFGLSKILDRIRNESPADGPVASPAVESPDPQVPLVSTPADASSTPAAPPTPALAAAPVKPVDVARVLDRVRQNTTMPETTAATPESDPATENDLSTSFLVDSPAAP